MALPEEELSSRPGARPQLEPREIPRLLPDVVPELDSRARSAIDEGQWDERRELTTQGRADAEPNEVHVHIGRIEVTAVHEPPGKRPKREPALPKKTLAEYLSGRGKGPP